MTIKNEEKHRERLRKAARKYYYSVKGKEAHRRKNKRYYELNKDKKLIRAKTRYLIKIGVIIRRNCKICGNEAEPHHTSYDSEYTIEWYCRDHHLKKHYGMVD